MRGVSAVPSEKDKLVLVRLTPEQIAKAKAANGAGKRITHALLCGRYGQMFGTEKQCRKYFDAWIDVFSRLFVAQETVDWADLRVFASTPELVHKLLEADAPLERRANAARLGYRSWEDVEAVLADTPTSPPSKPRGLLSRVFGRR
jgi:hypothetical protein